MLQIIVLIIRSLLFLFSARVLTLIMGRHSKVLHSPARDTDSRSRTCLLILLTNFIRYLPVISDNKSPLPQESPIKEV